MGFTDALVRLSSPYRAIANVYRGVEIDRTTGAHRGFLYRDLVGAVRQRFPLNVLSLTARAIDLALADDGQQVTLSTGEVIRARLVVLASGMSDTLCRKVGIANRVVSKHHSFNFGFMIEPTKEAVGFDALTLYGRDPRDRTDYLNVFPTTHGLRGNLFTYRTHDDPWVRQFKKEPAVHLRELFPELDDYLGAFSITSRVENWLTDLTVAENYFRPGLVVVGDAFQTSCPAVGVGLTRAISDVEALLRHAPGWFASPKLDVGEVAEFYSDPAKLALDRTTLSASLRRRSNILKHPRLHRAKFVARFAMSRVVRSPLEALLRLKARPLLNGKRA